MFTTTRRDEITFRKIYMPLVLAHAVTTIFRPGRRLCSDPKGYCAGELVKLRIVEKVGADWANLPGQLREDVGEPVRIVDVRCVRLADLTPQDFAGSTPDVHDRQSLVMHLGLLYNLHPDELRDGAQVTKTIFAYL